MHHTLYSFHPNNYYYLIVGDVEALRSQAVCPQLPSIGIKWQSWKSNPGSLKPQPKLLTTRPYMFPNWYAYMQMEIPYTKVITYSSLAFLWNTCGVIIWEGTLSIRSVALKLFQYKGYSDLTKKPQKQQQTHRKLYRLS